MSARRQSAGGPVGEILRFNSERVVEVRPVVLPCDRGSELDYLRLGQFFLQAGEECAETSTGVWVMRSAYSRTRALEGGEVKIVAIAIEVGDLLREIPLAGLRSLDLNVSLENFGVMRSHLHGHDDAAEPATGEGINKAHKHPADQSTLIAASTVNTRHWDSPAAPINLGWCG